MRVRTKQNVNSSSFKNNSKYNTLEQLAFSELDTKLLPSDVTISTMTIYCKAQTVFNCYNIAKYIDLTLDSILSVTYGKVEDPETNRTLIKKKKTSAKKKKKKNIFYNQISMYVYAKGKKDKKPVNVKLFSNGAIQMTGCQKIDNAVDVLNKIFYELKKEKAILDPKENKIVMKLFATNLKMLDLKKIDKLNIAMINSGFKMPFKIDRGKLYNLLIQTKNECLYDPVKHACVNIKYEHPDKTISIFVFEKGSIIITGAKNCEQIKSAYDFINKYLLTHHSKIKKNDNLTNQNIIKYLDPDDITSSEPESN